MSKKGGRGRRSGGNIGGGQQVNMLQQVQKMQDDMAAAQEALAEETFEVSVGGGAVTVIITGHQRVESIAVSPEVIDMEDEEWLVDLQDLLVAGVNAAIEESQKQAAEQMESITGSMAGMLPPGLGGLFGG